MLVAVVASALIWLYLLFARGSFWLVSRSVIPEATTGFDLHQLRVTAIIPARNEADTIARSVTSLLKQIPSLQVIVVDDASSDNTAQLARQAATDVGLSDHLRVLITGGPQPGWTGKLSALQLGVETALAESPDYLLFSDADIEHQENSIRDLVAIAHEGKFDLSSLMVKLANRTFAEKALIPAFVYYFLQLYPPVWIRSRRSATAGAAGGCLMITPRALANIGGLASVRHQIIDDCSLAREVKRRGGSVWMGLSTKAASIRSYQSWAEIERMIARSAFSQLQHSAVLLSGTTFGLILTYIVPWVSVLSGELLPAATGAVTILLTAISYLPAIRFYRQSWLWSFALPLITIFYLFATFHSAVLYWRGRGGTWKGRIQDLT